jgi:hypothetical protein
MSRSWASCLGIVIAIVSSHYLALMFSPPDMFMFSLYLGGFLASWAVILGIVSWKVGRPKPIGRREAAEADNRRSTKGNLQNGDNFGPRG